MAKKEEQVLTGLILENFRKMQLYTDDPNAIQKHAQSIEPQDPYQFCTFGTPIGFQLKLYQGRVWNTIELEEESKDEILFPLFDVRCKGFTALKTNEHVLCRTHHQHSMHTFFVQHTKPRGLTGKRRLIKKAKDKDTCCEILSFDYFTRFQGFLRVCQLGDQFCVLGCVTNGEKAQVVYKVVIEEDSSSFLMRCLDFENRIILWSIDSSCMRNEDENGDVHPETVILNFPNNVTYRMVSAVLKARYVSKYVNFVERWSQGVELVSESEQKKVFGTEKVKPTVIEMVLEKNEEKGVHPFDEGRSYKGTLEDETVIHWIKFKTKENQGGNNADYSMC